jgi:hypothetical protein
VPNPGDVFVADNGRVLHIDGVTGDRTVISCWAPSTCPGGQLIGTGPDFFDPRGLAVSPSGSILIYSVGGDPSVIAIDPTTGDRTVLSNSANGEGAPMPVSNQPPTLTVWPRRGFFIAAIAALPIWGIPLIVGIFIGVSLRLRRRGATKT